MTHGNMTAVVRSKLPRVGTTIFTVMSQLAMEHEAVNLGQGFPDFRRPQALRDALAAAVAAGRNQYAPMTGVPALREQIALKTERCTVARSIPDTDSHRHLRRNRGALRRDRRGRAARATR